MMAAMAVQLLWLHKTVEEVGLVWTSTASDRGYHVKICWMRRTYMFEMFL